MTEPRDVPHSDLCEWDPERDRPAQGERVAGDAALKWRRYTGCPNLAAVIVGADGKWRLCESCAALPAFKRCGLENLSGGVLPMADPFTTEKTRDLIAKIEALRNLDADAILRAERALVLLRKALAQQQSRAK